MWEPVQNLSQMSRDERMAFLSFTSDDMKEQIVTYLLNKVEELSEVKKTWVEIIEFLKKHNKKLIEENNTFKNKNKFERYKSNKLRSQVADLVEKLRLRP